MKWRVSEIFESIGLLGESWGQNPPKVWIFCKFIPWIPRRFPFWCTVRRKFGSLLVELGRMVDTRGVEFHNFRVIRPIGGELGLQNLNYIWRGKAWLPFFMRLSRFYEKKTSWNFWANRLIWVIPEETETPEVWFFLTKSFTGFRFDFLPDALHDIILVYFWWNMIGWFLLLWRSGIPNFTRHSAP